MEKVQDTCKVSITCDLVLAWISIAYRVTVKNSMNRDKYWSNWSDYYKEYGTEPYLHSVNPCEQSIILTAFAARVYTGAYGQGYQVRVQSVTGALTAISKNFQMGG